MVKGIDPINEISKLLKELRLPTIRKNLTELILEAQKQSFGYEEFLHHLFAIECDQRRNNKAARLLKAANLPLGKTTANFVTDELTAKSKLQLKSLLSGIFLEKAASLPSMAPAALRHPCRAKENILVFGKPGTGKTHLVTAIARELLVQGHTVFFSTTALIVQDLLKAKAELKLPHFLRKINRYEMIVIDDIGYVHQSREEMEVLFTLLAERYERGSVALTSNLPFSKWEQIFKDPMTTAAAIDRLIHHSVIIELNNKSFRLKKAEEAKNH